MLKDFERVLISQDEIQKRVLEISKQLSEDYAGKDLMLICILKGSIFFFADIFRNMTIPTKIDFMAVSSYGSGTTSGELKISKDLKEPIEGKDVLIIEDIVDSGRTLSKLKQLLLERNPASVKICSLLDKPDRRIVDVDVDYVGFCIPDEFVVGYGLDYDENYRQYQDIYVLSRSVYEK